MSAPASLPYQFPDVPGLVLEPMTELHLDEAAALLVEALPHWRCAPDSPCREHGGPDFHSGPTVHARQALALALAAPDRWALALTFRGRPLQFEVIAVDAAAGAAESEVALHASRERPAWVWREAARPVMEALAAAGIARVSFWTGADRRWARTWVPFYQEAFGAVETADFGRGGSRRYEFPVDLARFAGWPPRKTLGPGWALEASRTRTWEATEADFPAVRARLAEIWQGRAERRALTERMLEEWWTLDRATLLLGTVDGELRDARLIRHRAADTAGVAMLLPAEEDAEQDALVLASARWMREAGYTTATMFIPNSNLVNPKTQRLLDRARWRHVARHELRTPFVEVAMDLAAKRSTAGA